MKIALYKAIRPGVQGVFSRAARGLLRSIYSHGELVYSNGDSASCSFIDGGVRTCDDTKFPRIVFNSDKWDFFSIVGDEQRSRDWYKEHAGMQYDLRGMLACALPVLGHNPVKTICTASIAESFGWSDSWRYTPPVLASVSRIVRSA